MPPSLLRTITPENLIGMMEPLKAEPEFVGIMQISLVLGCVGILAGAGPALAASAVGLGAVTGAVHLVGGGILKVVPGVSWMGEIVIDRFVHAQSNWTLQPLRSFTEIGAWLYVIFSVQATSRDWQLSVLIGSLLGLPIVLLGEILRRAFDQIHASLAECLQVSPQTRFHLVRPGFIWLGYFSGVVLAAGLSKSDQEGTGRAVMLSVLTGAALISAGQLMIVWRPTRSATLIMQGRILNAGQHWRLAPIRSAVELSSFVGLTCGCYSMTNDSLISLGLSTCAGIAVCICSEHVLGTVNDQATRARASEEKPMLLPLAAFNCTLFVLYVIFSRAQSLAFALVLSAVASVAVCAIGRLCLLFPCTLVVGRILDGRFKNAQHNWEQHPIRSGYELIVWQLCLFASFSYYGQVTPAVQLSCALGGGNVLINNLLFPIKESDPAHSPRISPKSVPKADPVLLDLDNQSPRDAKKPDEITINQRIVRCVDKSAPMQVGVDGQWIDVKNFAKHHPGGDVIYEFLNRDASTQFYAFHSPSVLTRFKAVGKYDMSATETGKQPAEMAFLSMVKRLDKEGFFGPENAYYARKVALCAGLMVCVVAGVWRGHVLLPGMLLGMFWMQAGFLTHDLMHNQIFKKRKEDQSHGWFWGNICLGASCVWWRDEHFEHHVFTNTYLKGTGSTDPQQHEAPLWAQDAALRETTNLFLLRIQHYTFLPILVLFGRIGLVLASYSMQRGMKEHFGCLLHWVYVGALLRIVWLQHAWYGVFCFYFAGACVQGILGVQLSISHYDKEFIEKDDAKNGKAGWLRRQVYVSKDVDCPWWLDWFHGGLNLHRVHHLMPRLSRCRYREVTAQLDKLLDDHEIKSDIEPFSTAISSTLSHMRKQALLVTMTDLIGG